MKPTDALSELQQLGVPVFETREVSARLGLSTSRTSQILRSLKDSGLALQVRHGLWTIQLDLDPYVLPPYLTVPFPSYVSFWSALARHGMIEQVPRQIFAASLGRPRRIATSIGTYSMHHLAPELFSGYRGSDEVGYIATREKALFDTVYLNASKRGHLRAPEIELPRGFREDMLRKWTKMVSPPRLRTLVSRSLETTLASARRG
jgi:predicted transcriptional regulator of viral defense system